MAATTLLGARGGPPALAVTRIEVRAPRSTREPAIDHPAPGLAFIDLPGAAGLDRVVRRRSFVAVAGPRGRAAILRAFSPAVETIPLVARRIAPAHNENHLLVSDGSRVHVLNEFGHVLESSPVADRDLAGELEGVGYFGWRGVWNHVGGPVLIGERARPLTALGPRLLAAEPHRGMALLSPLTGAAEPVPLPASLQRRWTHTCATSHDREAAAMWFDDTLVVVEARGAVHHRTVPDPAGPLVWLVDGHLLAPVTDNSRGTGALVFDRTLHLIGHTDLPAHFTPHADVSGLIEFEGIVELSDPLDRSDIPSHSAASAAGARRHHRSLAAACGLPDGVAANTRPSVRLAGISLGGAIESDEKAERPRALRSQIGGRPQLPAGVSWPHAGSEPMAFLGQLDLAEVHTAHPGAPLPTHGHLFVFGHLDPEGHEPGESERATMLITEPVDAPSHPWPERLDTTHRFDPVAINCSGFESIEEVYKSLDDLAEPGEDLLDPYLAFLDEAHPPRPDHRLFGFHRALQRDDIPTPSSPHQQLLLQLDTDARLGAFWGPGGMVYVYVDPFELAALSLEAGAPSVAHGTLYLDD